MIADIIIPHHDQHQYLKECLDKLDNKIFNIIITSGHSFAVNNNRGAKITETENFIFLNDDVVPDMNILKAMAQCEADIVGVAQKMDDREGIAYGITFRNGLDDFAYTPEEIHIPSGFCFKIKRKVWNELEGFDERFVNGAEDTDLFLKALERGYMFNYIANPLIHHHSKSSGRLDKINHNRELLNKKWPKDKIISLINENFHNNNHA